MDRKVINSMTWVVALVAIILSVGVAACSDDDTNNDSGPQPEDGTVNHDGVQPEDSLVVPDTKVSNCPVKDTQFLCQKSDKSDKTGGEIWKHTGSEGVIDKKPACKFRRVSDLSNGWFIYNSTKQTAIDTNDKTFTCTLAK